ncbi:MAG: hypothetical protein HXX13_13220 [Bacteroidetes bacterium]|nr:hypothetical protein [Bacteroidota bacterium]
MKHLYIFLINFFILGSLMAQSELPFTRGSYHTASLMQKGKWESGLLQPFRYGLSEKLEINSNILLMPLMPNLGIKVRLGSYSGFLVSSEHQLSIPSAFLNTVSRKGTGGLISPEFDFPFMLGINSGIIASKTINDLGIISLTGGFALALRTGKIDPMATIDLPVFFPRMAQYYKGVSIRVGSSFQGRILKNWNYEENIRLFFVTRNETNFNAENSGNIFWKLGKKLTIKGGYILTYGSYPFGNHWQLWPSFDLLFGSRQANLSK